MVLPVQFLESHYTQGGGEWGADEGWNANGLEFGVHSPRPSHINHPAVEQLSTNAAAAHAAAADPEMCVPSQTGCDYRASSPKWLYLPPVCTILSEQPRCNFECVIICPRLT